MIRHLPNLISLFRLVIAPVVFREVWNRQYDVALAWCFAAGFSDALDGFLARLLKVSSRTGAYLDPLADKVLLSGLFLVLGLDGAIPWWMPAVVFGRDALMLLALACAFLFTKLRDFPPSLWGKLSTILQIVTALVILLLLVNTDFFGRWGRDLRMLMMVLTAVATTWSAIHYAWLGVGMLRRARVSA